MKSLERLYCSALSVHRLTVIVLVTLLTSLSLWGIRGLGVDADFMALLDPSGPAVKTYTSVSQHYTGTDAFALFIEDREKINEQTLPQFIAKLEKLNEAASVRMIPIDHPASSAKQDALQPVLILVKPVFKPTDFSQSRQLSKTIRSLAEQLNVPTGITGSYQILIESADAANRDMVRSGVVTLIGILTLLLLVFRIPWIVVLCMAVTLCIGLIWTLGLVRLTMGQLNLLTATLPAVILGLGVDFSLHMIYAFHEKASSLSADRTVPPTETRTRFLVYLFSTIYKPLLIGAITTCAAFLSLLFAGSNGLRQMGLMGAFGIASTFIIATGLLPIMLSALPVTTLTNIRQLSGKRLSGFKTLSFMGRLISVMVLIVTLGGWGAAKVRFSSDQNKLADQSLPAYVLQNKLQDRQGLSLTPIAFVSADAETERAKLAFLESLPDSPFGLVESYLLAQQQHDDPDRFLGADGSHLILAYPKSNAFDPVVFRQIESAADQTAEQFPGPDNKVTGSPFLNAALNQTIQTDLLHCSGLAALLVFAVIFYCFRTAARTAAAMLPVILGTILMVGVMGYVNIDFTVMTIVIVPLIIGAGIDDGVHLLSRWYTENKNMTKTLHGVATPIFATTLTSMIAFGSLMLSGNPGFRQLGLVVMAGLGFCLLTSLWILPSLLNVIERGRS